MGDSTRLAVAIGVIFIAMVCLFFAFHPGGVQGASDPATMTQWLMSQYDIASLDPATNQKVDKGVTDALTKAQNEAAIKAVTGTGNSKRPGISAVNPPTPTNSKKKTPPVSPKDITK